MTPDTTLWLALIGAVILLLFIALLSVFAHSENEQRRRNQQAEALLPDIAEKSTHSELLTDAIGQLKPVFDLLHTEHVELAGYRAELNHTLAMAETFKKGRSAGSSGQRGFEKEQLSHARDLLRLNNEIADSKDRAELRPLRMDAQKAGLEVRANKRVIENILTQQAAMEARRRGGEAVQPEHLTNTIAELVEAVESRKADGEDAGDLEQTIQTLRALTAKNGGEARS